MADEKDTQGVDESATVTPADEQSQAEKAGAILLEDQAKLLVGKGEGAGEDYLYPDAPVSAQNPPKRAIINYVDDSKN